MNNENQYMTPKDRVSGALRSEAEMSEMRNRSSLAVSGIFKSVREQNSRSCTYPSLAMVYAPEDSFDDLFDTDTALSKGTLFSKLEFPFKAYCCGKKNYPAEYTGGKKR